MNMNKILFASVLLCGTAMLFTSCKNEEDDLFSQSAAERLDSYKTQYTSQMVDNAPNGWVFQYFPNEETSTKRSYGYVLLMKFFGDHRVAMAMSNRYSQTGAYATDTSLWEIITDNGPVLSFNSYNECLHAFSNPFLETPTINYLTEATFESGEGIGGDYEFVIVDAPAEGKYVTLKGKKRATYSRMLALPEAVDSKQYFDELSQLNSDFFPKSFTTKCRLIQNGQTFVVDSMSTGLPVIYPEGGNATDDGKRIPFVMAIVGDKYNVRFRDPIDFSDKGNDKSASQEFIYNPADDTFESVSDNGAKLVPIQPIPFFQARLKGVAYSIRYDNKTSMSDNFSTLMNNFRQQQSGFSSIDLKESNGTMLLTVHYTRYINKRYTPAEASFKYQVTYNAEDNTITLVLDGPMDTIASTLLANNSALQPLLQAFEQTFKVSGHATNFSLRRMKMVSTTDSNMWIIFN